MRRLHILLFALGAFSAQAARVGEQSAPSLQQENFALPESFSALIEVADSFDGVGSIKLGTKSVSPSAVSAQPSSAPVSAASPNTAPSSTSPKESEKVLPAKTVTAVVSSPATGEVPAGDVRYDAPAAKTSVFGGRAEPSLGSLLSNAGTGNLKALSDTLAPVAGTPLRLSEAVPGLAGTAPGKAPAAAKAPAAPASKSAEKGNETPKDTLPGTPGDPNVNRAKFGKNDGDNLALSDREKERKEQEEREKKRREQEEKDKDKDKKQETPEEKDKRLADLKSALSGEISQSNYEKLAEQILSNPQDALDMIRETPQLRDNAKRLIEKFAREDRNLERKRAAEKFLRELDRAGSLDEVERPQPPPSERPIHNE